jgi:hypothetical protein
MTRIIYRMQPANSTRRVKKGTDAQGPSTYGLNAELENFLNINASEAYKRPWHRLERGLRLNRIRNFVEAEKVRLVLSDDDTEYLKVKIEKALEKKLLNSKTCVVYDQDKEEIQEIKGLIYHKTADGRMLSSIVDKKLGTTFRRKKDLPQGDASQKQNMKSDEAANEGQSNA